MRYIQLFEKFNSSLISKTLRFLKEKGISSSDFMREIKNLMEYNTDIDKIEDTDFEYLSAKQALKSNKYTGEKYTSIKYWFSLDDGYLGSSLTIGDDINFTNGRYVKYKDKIYQISERVSINTIRIMDSNGTRTTVSIDEVSKVSDEEIEEYLKENSTTLDFGSWLEEHMIENDIYNITEKDNLLAIIREHRNHHRRYTVLWRENNKQKWKVGELEIQAGTTYFLYNGDMFGYPSSSESGRAYYTRYQQVGDSGETYNIWRNFIRDGGEMLVINHLNINLPAESLQTINFEDVNKNHINKIQSFINDYHKSPCDNREGWLVQTIRHGWTPCMARRHSTTYNCWLYKDPDFIFVASDEANFIDRQDIERYTGAKNDRTKYSRLIFKATSGSIDMSSVVFSFNNVQTNKEIDEAFQKRTNRRFSYGSSELYDDGIFSKEALKKADFCLILDYNVLGKHNTKERRTHRIEQREGALSLKTEKEILSERLDRYVTELVRRSDIDNKDMQEWRINNIILSEMGKYSILHLVHPKGFRKSKSLINYLGGAATAIKDNDEPYIKKYLDAAKGDIQNIYKTRLTFDLEKYAKSINNEKSMEVFKLILECSQIINDKIKKTETKGFSDTFILKSNLDKIHAICNQKGGKYDITGLYDTGYSYINNYKGDAEYYFKHLIENDPTRTDKVIEGLKNLKEYLKRIDLSN